MPPKKTAKHQKKRKSYGFPSFGAPTKADDSSAQNSAALPSSSAACIRNVSQTMIPPLTTLCARIFVANFLVLRKNARKWECCDSQLRLLPDVVIPKLSAMLQTAWPTYLSDGFITTHLLRGPEISLSYELPGIRKHTISSIERMGSAVRELTLVGFKDVEDRVFSSILRHTPCLEKLVLRGCARVAALTIEALAEHCPQIKVINLNYTSVSPTGLIPLANSRSHRLESLKFAGIQNWTDTTFSKFLSSMDDDFSLPNLQNLKLRQTQLSETSLTYIIPRCPALKHLDISFTNLRHLPPNIGDVSHLSQIEKLSLTSTQLPPSDLIDIIRKLPNLKVLLVGALGGSTLTMTDDVLSALTDALATLQGLEKVSLVANQKLGILSPAEDNALGNFIRSVGRRCKSLNLAGLQHLRSVHLSGLSAFELGGLPPIETLILDNTGIDDEAGVYIGACHSLKTLSVSGTKLTREGIFPIVDNCQQLVSLDVTSCRGIKVTERRRIFEVWEEERQHQSPHVY